MNPDSKRKVGPFEVNAIGFGCMNLSHAYGAPPPPEQGERLLLQALDAGVDFFDTAALYGFGASESLVGQALSKHRQRFVLASKCGMQGVEVDGKMTRVIDGRPNTIRATCEDSLRRLKTDVIDLYYLHRWDKLRGVPIEDSVGALSDLLRAGKIRSIGLSEVSADTLHKAQAVHPIAAVQTEYSLWTRNPEIAVLDACRELGAAFVAFSPLARGFLTGRLQDVSQLGERDIRRGMPRFDPRNLRQEPEAAAALSGDRPRTRLHAGATGAGLGAAQGAARRRDTGTTRLDHLEENIGAAQVRLDAKTVERLDELINQRNVVGPRYNAQSQSEVDTEMFP